METRTHTLETPDVDLIYDLRGPSPTAGERPPLLMVGHPMDARGFDTLASYFSDRTVVTYDPRGIGRSIRRDGRDDRTPELHATDLHALITALGAGPVDVFASSGGAVNALALVADHPEDVGARDDPLLSGTANAITSYRPDVQALAAAPTRVVIGEGVESRATMTARAAAATAHTLHKPLVEFPS